MNQPSVGLILALFVPFFIAMWVFVLRLLSLFGWSRLAAHYEAHSEPSLNAEKRTWQALSIGRASINYGQCINSWIDDTGVYLRPNLPFRLFHPMILLRWNQIRLVEEQSFLFAKTAKLQMVQDVPFLILRGNLGKAVLERWQRLHPNVNR